MKAAAPWIVLFLGSCAPLEPASETTARVSASSVPMDEASCRLAGGTMSPAGRRQLLQCTIAYPDAGKSCSASDQCAGECRAPSGSDIPAGQVVQGLCQADSNRFGCSTRVEGGRAQATLCVD
jgi:hypothetical protein